MKKRLQEINIGDTINSGQVFLWQKIGQKWYGIDGQNVLIINEKTKKIRKNSTEFNFFRQDDNFEEIYSYMKKDRIVKKALDAVSYTHLTLPTSDLV